MGVAMSRTGKISLTIRRTVPPQSRAGASAERSRPAIFALAMVRAHLTEWLNAKSTNPGTNQNGKPPGASNHDLPPCYNSLPHNDLLGHYELLAGQQRNHVMSVLGCAGLAPRSPTDSQEFPGALVGRRPNCQQPRAPLHRGRRSGVGGDCPTL